MKLARALSITGRTLITVGVLMLLFVAYQLWGTGVYSARAQNDLERQFQERLADADGAEDEPASTSSSSLATTSSTDGSSVTTATLPPSTVPALVDLPADGEAVGQIQIPRIGVDWIVVEGVSVRDLKKGPGHYPDTPFPGQAGNVSIAGHRTTYGAPFGNLDQLQPGDDVVVTTVQGRFTYKVTGQQVVKPSEVQVLAPTDDNRLTLTSCHPKYSARQRLVVTATLAGEPAPTTETSEPAEPRPEPTLDLNGESAPKTPAILWGLLCAAIWIAAWLLGRQWRRWPAYAIGLPFFALALFVFFENFSRLLPSSY